MRDKDARLFCGQPSEIANPAGQPYEFRLIMTQTKTTTLKRAPDQARRNFLWLIPLSIFAGMFGTLATAALRFLRPSAIAHETKWLNVAPVAQLTGERPIMRSIIAEHQAGWASTLEEHFVYVLPQKNHQVLSSICPHEGCNVTWRNETDQFVCPCHDSFFGADGARLSGPARRGLDPLPTRVENGVLQIQYQFFVNNTEERQVR